MRFDQQRSVHIYKVCLLLYIYFLSPAALQHLKRKKRYEKQLQDIDGTLSTVEFQLEALQNAQSNKQVLDTMKVASGALKKAHGNM